MRATEEQMGAELRAILGDDGLRENEPLAGHTTFRIGGPARWLAQPSSEDEVRAVVRACNRLGWPWRVLGLGSNVLVSDEGLDEVVLKLADRFAKVELREGVEGDRAAYVIAQAGATNAQVAEAACAAGLAGYEFASGIPGTVGGAAVMNAGAYGGEFADVAVAVRCLTPEGDVADVPAADAAWGYRTSLMMTRGYVVVSAILHLTCDDESAVRDRMDDLARRREEKQPLEMPSAGSTFKRPEGHFAGKLIQDAGLQGRSVGGAQVSTKHAGFVVNAGDATAADVLALIAQVQGEVRSRFGVALEPEVRLWGF